MTLAQQLKSLPDKELDDFLTRLDPKTLSSLTLSNQASETGRVTLKSVKKGLADSDFIQKIYTLLLLCLEIFKAGVACFLVLIVPMTCKTSAGLLEACSFQDLRQSNFYNFTLFWNYLTFVVLMLHYLAIWFREQFFIEYFDQDPSVPKTNLSAVLPTYSSIQTFFTFHNRLTGLTTTAFTISAVINTILSGWISYGYNPSLQSTTVLLTNVILISSILSRSITASLQPQRAFSMVQIEMIEFNQIDGDHLGDKGKLEVEPWYVKILKTKDKKD